MSKVFNLSQSQEMAIEHSAKAEWDRDPSIRAEFGTMDTYLAYRKANASGAVQVLGSSRIDVNVNIGR